MLEQNPTQETKIALQEDVNKDQSTVQLENKENEPIKDTINKTEDKTNTKANKTVKRKRAKQLTQAQINKVSEIFRKDIEDVKADENRKIKDTNKAIVDSIRNEMRMMLDNGLTFKDISKRLSKSGYKMSEATLKKYYFDDSLKQEKATI